MKLEAVQIKVLNRRDNGSGVIEIPIITISGDAITIEQMQEMVANHKHFPIVPVGVSPHREFDDRAGFSPAFLENPSLRNGVLFAELDLIAPLFHEVVELGGWRSFSIEARKNLKTTTQQDVVTRSIKGWVIVGGVFTNRPAVDAHFKIAASGRADSETTGTFSTPLLPEETTMADTITAPAKVGDAKIISLELHEEKIKTERDKSVALEAARVDLHGRLELAADENKRLRIEADGAAVTATDATQAKLEAEAKSLRLDTENRGLKSANVALKLSLTETETKHQEAVNKNLAAEVREIIETAIKPTDGKQGVPPRVFEGWSDDPAAYMVRTFTTLENFKTFVSALPGAGMEVQEVAKPTGSGHVPGTDPAAERDADEVTLTAEEEEVLDRLDLPSEYDGVMDEVAARKVHKKLEAAKAQSKE